MKFYLFFILMASASVHAQSFYRCTNDAGETSYQDSPCLSAAEEKKVHVFNPPQPGVVRNSAFTGDESMPLETALVIRSKISSVIATLSPFKMSVAQYYQTQGQWPKELSDIGIDEKEASSRDIQSMALDKEGAIVAYLNNSFGTKKQIRLQPKSILGGTSLEWECSANFTQQLLSANGFSMCESRVIN